MSAYAPVVVHAGPCDLCDNPKPAYDEGGTLVYLYQILQELTGDGGAPPLSLCRDCWYIAEKGADDENVSIIAGVHTIYA